MSRTGGDVSTRSRAKAAGALTLNQVATQSGFNSQPREGGWMFPASYRSPAIFCFNSQPREGGWGREIWRVHTHRCFNSQPREGGWSRLPPHTASAWRFNSQPREGGWVRLGRSNPTVHLFQLPAARRRLGPLRTPGAREIQFQLTAARRRLVI